MSGKDLYSVKCNIHEKALNSSCQHKQKFNTEKERQSDQTMFFNHIKQLTLKSQYNLFDHIIMLN